MNMLAIYDNVNEMFCTSDVRRHRADIIWPCSHNRKDHDFFSDALNGNAI